MCYSNSSRYKYVFKKYAKKKSHKAKKKNLKIVLQYQKKNLSKLLNP